MQLRTKEELLRYYCSGYGSLVSTAATYVPDTCHLTLNMNSIGVKTKELFRYYGCHGNLVIIVMKYVADVCHTKKSMWLMSVILNTV